MQVNLVAQLSSQQLIKTRSRYFLAVVALSVLAHGIVLGLPWPEPEIRPAPPAPPEPEATATMDVAILPSDTLRPPTERPVETSGSEPQDLSRPVVERSPVPPPSPTNAPPPPIDTPPPTSPEPRTEPRAPGPDPVGELPPEPGSPGLTTPPPPPTLQERLQDPGEYQYDGTQHFDLEENPVQALSIYDAWTVPGQTVPSLADPLQLPYELGAACLDAPPLRGTLMVVVDEVGNFRRLPEVVSSTGYAILDEQAEDWVRTGQYRLPNDNEAKAYAVNVEVVYPRRCL
ncbi:hypothetical protein [Leptolyngbya iicbica]|uniref:TonB C-terminal domain-containing protein n=2 Tax=Cyanophyceae TaxID=3028117 RepID=A0A4Q7E596_9CYAN|nr:hypothetical protein DYY88_16900 [Leptolyngbya sp. LK]